MKKYTVLMITLVSSLAFLLMLFGLIWTIQNQYSEREQTNIEMQSESKQESSNHGKTVIALGDSLTRGTGDEGGKGYIGYLVDQLNKKSKEDITVYNLGVKGFQSEQLLSQIKERGVQNQIKKADIVLITIGGNDLFQGGETLKDLNNRKVVQLRKKYLDNLEQTITALRGLNSKATIYLVGLYNPFIDLEDAKVTTKIVRQWNYETSELMDKHQKTVFVPTFDLFQLKVNDYLYTDNFHPNSKGYKLIAERVASLITW